MKQDEIIEMANQAELCQCIWIDDEGPEIASLVAFAKLVADVVTAKEREACAKLCEPQEQHDDPLTAWKIAEAIRARG